MGYVPRSMPLTPYQRELLECLCEECGEVIQAACKMLRFGKDESYPDGMLNSTKLGLEIGDMDEVIARIAGAQLVEHADIAEGMVRKGARLALYLVHAP